MATPTSTPSPGAIKAARALLALLADRSIVVLDHAIATRLLATTIQELTDGVERGTARAIATTIRGMAERARTPDLAGFAETLADVVRGAYGVGAPAPADDGEGGDGEGTSK